MKRIAVIVENFRAYGRAIIEGIAAYAQKSNNWMLRPISAEDAQAANLSTFDGVIVRLSDDCLAERLSKAGIPTVDVFCKRSWPGIASIDSDHRLLGQAARTFFAARGFKNFAYCGVPGTAFSDTRGQAFADKATHVYTAKRPSPMYSESQFYNEHLDKIPDAKPLARWLLSLPKPVAVFCCNDLRAIQLQRIALENGLRVPQDVSLLGVDNDTVACSFAEIPISSIDPNAFGVGHAAARVLDAIIRQPPSRRPHKKHCVKPGKIIERTSTDFMPIDPPWLGDVLMHVEKNLHRPVTAREIFALSQRSCTYVENVFRAKLGMSVQAYVTSVKLREAKRFLSDEPTLRISEIAYRCGFTSPQYFCRTFTANVGINPRGFREGKNRSSRACA